MSVDQRLRCAATWYEKRCVKPMYEASNGEVWDHAGGHFYASDEQAERLASGDYDASAVLANLVTVRAAGEPTQPGQADGKGREGA